MTRRPIPHCALILLAFVLLLGCQPDSGPPPRPDPVRPTAFTGCQGDRFALDLIDTLAALPDDTPTAHLEQLRDWVWTAFAARLAGRQKEPELLAGIARQPLFRDEAFSHLLDLPVGRSRAGTGRDGTVYVLVDRTSPRRTFEDALEAIDQESLAQGATPARAVVYGVDFRLETATAEVCRLGTVDRAWLEAPEQGFRRVRLSEAVALEQFLAGGVDLLSAHLAGDAIEVAGRVRTRAAGAPVTVEHVAALSQGGAGDEDLGFSLDPRTDIPAVAERLDELIAAFDRPGRLAVLLRGWGLPADEALNLALRASEARGPTRASLTTVRQAMDGDRDRAEGVLAEAGAFAGDPLFTEIVQKVAHHSGYQCARYDGPTQGTLPAMTMFYTDLVAKLWAMDWQRCSPTGNVPGFVSIPEHRESLAYCGRDEGAPYTRIWFGPRREGFVRDTPSALRFAPLSTRLFALGSARGSEHSEEVEPAARMLRFIRWWDRNYAAVAEWEPQYELLNQLMKWTLVRRMAETSGSSGLAFLDGVEVERSRRFDAWLTEQRDLRLGTSIRLAEKSGESTECLPLFESAGYLQCGGIFSLSGGVGLPRRDDVAERPVRAAQPAPYLGRVDPEVAAQRTEDGRWTWSPITRAKGELRDFAIVVAPDRVESGGTLDSRILLRGDQAFYDTRQVVFRQEHALADDGRRIRSRQTFDGYGVGRLTVRDLQLAAEAEGLLQAQRLGYDVSRLTVDGEDLTAAAHSVAGELPVLVLQDHRVAVKLRTAEGEDAIYAILDSGNGIRGPPPGKRFTVGAPEPEGDRGRGGAPRRGIEVSVAREREALPYLEREKARPVEESDVGVRAVRGKLAQGDLDGAIADLQGRQAPPRAVAEVAVVAARQHRLGVLAGMVWKLAADPPAAPYLRRVEDALGRARVELVRAGEEGGVREVTRLQMTLAVAARRLEAPAAALVLERLNNSVPLFYAQRGFTGTDLPPVTYPPGTQLAPGERFVADVSAWAGQVHDLPASFALPGLRQTAGGLAGPSLELVRVERTVQSPATSLAPYGSGSPWHPVPGGGTTDVVPGGDGTTDLVPGGGEEEEVRPPVLWPLIVVVPCTVEDDGVEEGLPSCYRPVGPQLVPAEATAIRRLIEDACDTDGDGTIDAGEEAACVEDFGEVAAARQRAAA